MIRVATIADINKIEELAWAFFEESPYRSSSYSSDKVITNLEKVISDPQKSVVLVQEIDNKIVGMLIGTTTESMFSNDTYTCELAWYVLPDYRGKKESLRLLEAYEYWSKNVVKATECSMASLGSDKVGRLYERRGYQKLEDTYVRKN